MDSVVSIFKTSCQNLPWFILIKNAVILMIASEFD